MSDEVIDPLNATSAGISRRGFALLGSAAIAGLTGVASPAPEFGGPHPPIVSEDDPSIVVSRPRLQPGAGGAIDAYAAMPRAVVRTTPGVVVVQQIWGVDSQIRDVVRRFAKEGFITIAPLLFGRLNAPSGDGASDIAPFSAVAKEMYAQGFESTDLTAAHDWIRGQADDAKIGIIGFCMGGGIALQEIVDSHAFAAAAMFYGSVRPGTNADQATTPSTFDFTSRISTPLIGSFGARDTSIKPQDVTAMFARLSAPHDVKIYDEAGHAFFDDTRPRYVPSAAVDAWRRTLAWFRTYLS